MPDIFFVEEGLPETGSVFRRTAARGVILKENRLLMVCTDAGDYKFPGGGVDAGESIEQALAREILEETGYQMEGEPRFWLTAHERRKGRTADILEMDSLYYFCAVGEEQAPLCLDDYEAEEHFHPVWVTVQEALDADRALLDQMPNPWIAREVMALEALLHHLAG